jgi:hypothetical protein
MTRVERGGGSRARMLKWCNARGIKVKDGGVEGGGWRSQGWE